MIIYVMNIWIYVMNIWIYLCYIYIYIYGVNINHSACDVSTMGADGVGSEIIARG